MVPDPTLTQTIHLAGLLKSNNHDLVTLELYAQAVGELRAVADDARARIERADGVIAKAQEFAGYRRRRTMKAAAKHT